MKVFKKSLFLFTTIIFITSCQTTKQEDIQSEISDSENEQITEIIELPPEPTAEELFIESLNNVNLEFTQMPKTANYEKAFSSTYKVFVFDNEKNPLSDYSVTFFFPAEKTGEVIFNKTEILTNAEGIAEYSQQPLSFGINDFVVAYPTPLYENLDVVDACLAKSIQAPIKVRSNIMTKGALLFVWDFNEKDRPVNNSYEMLSEIRSYGITLAGNAPVNESSYIDYPIEKLYKMNYEIVEKSYGYLVTGTIKFVEPVSEVEGGYKCNLIANIKTVNMLDGQVKLDKTYTHEAIGTSWSKATSKCKEEIAALICADLIYGL